MESGAVRGQFYMKQTMNNMLPLLPWCFSYWRTKTHNWLHLLGNKSTHAHTRSHTHIHTLPQSFLSLSTTLGMTLLPWLAGSDRKRCNICGGPRISALFCSNSATLIDRMLKAECQRLQGLYRGRELCYEISSSSSVDMTFQSVRLPLFSPFVFF